MTDSHDPSVEDRPAPQSARPDPAAFQLRGDPPRVMRLSRKALAVVGVAAGLGIGGSLIYALRPPGDPRAAGLGSAHHAGRPLDRSRAPARRGRSRVRRPARPREPALGQPAQGRSRFDAARCAEPPPRMLRIVSRLHWCIWMSGVTPDTASLPSSMSRNSGPGSAEGR